MILEVHGFGLGARQSVHTREEFTLAHPCLVLEVWGRAHNREQDGDENEGIGAPEGDNPSPHLEKNDEEVRLLGHACDDYSDGSCDDSVQHTGAHAAQSYLRFPDSLPGDR